MSSFNFWQDFYEIWRFESCPALLENIKSGAVVFFNKDQSNALWSMFISSENKHLMTIPNKKFNDVEKYDVSFDDVGSANALFERFIERTGSPDAVILFFDVNSACILKFRLLQEFWNEIFLISDETSIAIDINSKVVLFSFEDRFFIAI